MTEKGVSSAALARRLQITERTIARWRAGETEPSFPTIQGIGLALGVGADWFEPEEIAA